MANTKFIKSEFFFEEDVRESVAEVPVDKHQPWPENEKLKVVGKEIPRIDGYDKTSGTALYTFDINLPHMAHAKILRSVWPHARIKSIDTTQAENLPGVLAVITHKNIPEIKWFEDSFLFDTKIRYEGEEIAGIAAETEEIAEKALKLIKIEVEELDFTVDPGQAMKETAPKIHEGGNIVGGNPFTYERGNFEEGIKNADAIIEETYSTQVVVHNPTEPHCSVANWDGDKLTVWDSTQAIFTVRGVVSRALNIPENNVRVIKKYMGGGFGSKLAGGKYTVIAALLAKKTGRPVRLTLDRREMNLAVGNRPDSVQSLKLGAKKDGTLTAMSHYAYGSSGAYQSGAGCSWPFRTVYQCPNVKVEEYTVYINAGPGRPFRAPGHVQGTFAMDSAIDLLAGRINMDPLEFRLKNYAEKDQVYNIPYTSKKLREAYEAGAKAIGWEKRNKQPGVGTGRYKTGIGMGTQIWWGGGGPPAYVTLKLNRDYSVEVLAGSQDLGTGTYTFVAQVASEVLEIPMERISVILGDTGVVPYGPPSGGSVTSPSISPAVRDAAEQMKQKLMKAAAAVLSLKENDLVYKNGTVSSKSDPSKSIFLSDIMGKINEPVLVTTGAREANPEGYMIQTFGAQFADVEVDTLTGKVRVKKIVAAHDIGRVLNRTLLENQFHGGIIQGIGFALMEERIIDGNTGKVLTTNLHDYKLPLITDMPEIEVIIVSEGDPMISNTGVKGIGEPAHIPTAAAIANAIFNATGVQIKSTPMTPDKVLMALSQNS
ncbi:MAG: xanthine dehydrogenase family protein molybdopterin-binding subunit [Calditrichaceae bacterium]|nr:xanthine dehydrogenase family protein molybdopterin-binding subunit [Calditrichaceae bacterium]MBN2709804.1 xanthine dehydrogenase family protein molybdopterin-binding subunit [Calditrichaceae bacterium]RQV94999.1 MAG: xanthine dehydrogenase family protein molybdopterin-binding subunit [Calditrichota bacterium]